MTISPLEMERLSSFMKKLRKVAAEGEEQVRVAALDMLNELEGCTPEEQVERIVYWWEAASILGLLSADEG